MSIYISGPMSGYEGFNHAAFHAAEAAIRRVRQDAQTINPASVQLWQDAEWADWMRHHIATIAREVTEVVVLPDWETSRGARLEVHIAHALGIPVKPLTAWINAVEVRRLTAEAATQREWFEAADAAAERRLDQSIAWMERAESAEAEVVTLRAKVAAVEAVVCDWPCSDDTCDGDCTGCSYASDLRAALAVTTGEGQ